MLRCRSPPGWTARQSRDESHRLIGLGTAAAEKGFRVSCTLGTRLVDELVEAAGDKTLARTIARCGWVDLLMIDALGYMALDRRGAELLLQVVTEREHRCRPPVDQAVGPADRDP